MTPQEKHAARPWILALPVVLTGALMFCVLALAGCRGAAASAEAIDQDAMVNMRRGTLPVEVRLPDEPDTPPSGALTFLDKTVKDGTATSPLRATIPDGEHRLERFQVRVLDRFSFFRAGHAWSPSPVTAWQETGGGAA